MPKLQPADLATLGVDELIDYSVDLAGEQERVMRAVRARWSANYHCAGTCWCGHVHPSARDAADFTRKDEENGRRPV